MSSESEDQKNCTFVSGSGAGGDHGHGHSHSHGHSHGEDGHSHGHSHVELDGPGEYAKRDPPKRVLEGRESFDRRAFTIGIAGPVGSGKSHLMLELCKHYTKNGHENIAAVTNDIFTKEDAEFLTRKEALAPERIKAVETGGCPHAATLEDISQNLLAAESLTAKFHPELILMEAGGDNLTATFSRELADYIIYVIDVAGGEKIPRKGGPGITQSDLLVINKTDLAEAVGSDLGVMDRDAKRMRGEGPTIFTQIKHGKGVPEIADKILKALHELHPEATKKAKTDA